MNATPSVIIRRIVDGACYVGTIDKNAVWGDKPERAAPFTRRDDAIRRCRGLAGEEWGTALRLEAAR